MIGSRLPLRLKLTLTTAIASVLALLMASAGFLYYDLSSFRNQMTSSMTTQGQIIASNCSAAMAFGDPTATEEVLMSLRAQAAVERAIVLTPDGQQFATYPADAQEQISTKPDGAYFENDGLVVYQTIRSGKDVVGTLYLRASLGEWNARLNNFVAIVSSLVLVCTLLAMLVGAALQRQVSKPILQLAEAMRSVEENEKYDLRVEKRTNDEVGQLVDGFNTMLAKIEGRDRQLHQINEELEKRVFERTMELELEIVERQAAQEELTRSQQALEDFFENATVGLQWFDHEGKILKANRAELEMFGYSADEYLGRNFADFQVDAGRAEELLQRLSKGETLTGFEVRVRCKDGRVKHVAIDANVLWEHSEFTHARCFTRDLTAEKEAKRAREQREQAERANLAKSEFLSRMSHELRTPMNSILGFSQLLQMEDLTEDQQDSVDQIVNAGNHLLRLINEVLDISRIEAGKLTISNEAVDLHESIKEIVSLVAPLAAQKSITVIPPDVNPEQMFVLADRQRLCQVLLNLASNAIKYNHDSGEVRIECESRGEVVRISVKDNGMGIPPEKAAKIFTPFERLGAEQTTIEGTGLGLALSKRLTEAMGGEIGMEPQEVGSCFFVELPKAESPLRVLETNAWDALDDDEGDVPVTATILIVEDNKANVKLAEKVLSSRPQYGLLVAMNGTAGLELARQHTPDLVLLDLNLPDSDGYKILQELRQHVPTAHVPVVIVSADANPAQVERLLSAGADDYLTKPLDVKAFLSTVDRFCSLKVKKSA